MQAAIITRFGGPEVLELRDVPAPSPRERQVQVRVRASAINRADLLQRQGRYPAPNDVPADCPGLEFAGEISALGPLAGRWRVGERVFGIVGGGAQAEFLTVHEDAIAAIPPALDWHDAGAVPEAFITAHDALVTQAQLKAGETVLVHAAGSGVGLAVAQLAMAWDAIAYGTSRSADKLVRARAFGLTDGIALVDSLEALGPAVTLWTSGKGIDVVIDLVGGAYVAPSIEALALKGRMMLVGTVAGGEARLDLRRMLSRRLTVRGTVLRARALEEKIAVTRAFEREVLPLFQSGRLRATIDRVYPLAEIADAHRRIESNDSFGKVVISIP